MPTPNDPGRPHDGPVLEPARVLRPRRTDALAELFRQSRQDPGDYESVLPAGPADAAADDDTQELPPVPAEDGSPAPAGSRRGRGAGPRRTAVVAAVSAAALTGFGCALLLPGTGGRSAAPAAPPAATAPAPAPATTATSDPDGPGTLRETDSGPEVAELQERLLRVPDVYDHGSTGGRYDRALTEAVARFQLWYGVRGDENGVYGDDTRLALESRTAPAG